MCHAVGGSARNFAAVRRPGVEMERQRQAMPKSTTIACSDLSVDTELCPWVEDDMSNGIVLPPAKVRSRWQLATNLADWRPRNENKPISGIAQTALLPGTGGRTHPSKDKKEAYTRGLRKRVCHVFRRPFVFGQVRLVWVLPKVFANTFASVILVHFSTQLRPESRARQVAQGYQ